MHKRFWFDVFRNVAEPQVSVSVGDVLPLLCIVGAEVLLAATLLALERWVHLKIKIKQLDSKDCTLFCITGVINPA
jgi:hypothetical protein